MRVLQTKYIQIGKNQDNLSGYHCNSHRQHRVRQHQNHPIHKEIVTIFPTWSEIIL